MVRRCVGSLLSIALVMLSALPAVAQGRVRVAVLNFDNNSTWAWWGDNLGQAAADELTTQLVNSGRFTVIERAQLAAIMAEQNLGASGRVTGDTAAKIGKLLGAQLILTGSITQFSIERRSAGFRGIGGSIANAESKIDVASSTQTGEVMAVAEGQGNKRMAGGYFKGASAERTFDQGRGAGGAQAGGRAGGREDRRPGRIAPDPAAGGARGPDRQRPRRQLLHQPWPERRRQGRPALRRHARHRRDQGRRRQAARPRHQQGRHPRSSSAVAVGDLQLIDGQAG